MDIKAKIRFTVEFETIESIPESFHELAERLIKTGDHSETALEDNIRVMIETEMDGTNVVISDVSMTATKLEGEV